MSLIHDALEKVNGAPIPDPKRVKKNRLRAPIIRLLRWYASVKNGRRKSVLAGLVVMLSLIPLVLFVRLFWPESYSSKSMAAKPAGRSAPFVLTGIVDGREKIAVINNRPVKVGETISGARVKEIRNNRVTLAFRWKKIYLSL